MFQPSLRKLALACSLAIALASRADAAALPRLEADSMGGTHVVLPSDASGKPFILLLAFTKEAEDQLKMWTRKTLADNEDAKATVYVVVVADKTVFFGRGKVRKLVEGAGVGNKQQIQKQVLLTFNGAGWRDLTPPGDKETIGVVVCDANGNVLFAKREPYSDANVEDVEKLAK